MKLLHTSKSGWNSRVLDELYYTHTFTIVLTLYVTTSSPAFTILFVSRQWWLPSHFVQEQKIGGEKAHSKNPNFSLKIVFPFTGLAFWGCASLPKHFISSKTVWWVVAVRQSWGGRGGNAPDKQKVICVKGFLPCIPSPCFSLHLFRFILVQICPYRQWTGHG